MKDTVIEFLEGKNAHAPFEKIVSGVSEEKINDKADGVPYSLWELLEHIRVSQEDILEFIKNPGYEEKEWPDEYWSSEEGTLKKWKESVKKFKKDRKELIKIAKEKSPGEELPYQEGYTYLRELMLVAVHTSYHLGQIVVLRRILRDWPQ